jgi:lipoprotein-anchoring transpeptidase ErfK/SrfK
MVTIGLVRSVGVLLVAGALLAGCGGSGDPGAGPTVPPAPSPARSQSVRDLLRHPLKTAATEDFPAYAVWAKGPSVPVYDAPSGSVRKTFGNPQPSGAPLVFLLDKQRAAWLHVYLPARPNGSTGWVRAADVEVRGVTYRVDVLRSAHQLRLYERGSLVKTFPVAIGTRDTPTPGGTFYLKELIRPTNGGGVYGPYAYGLSGFSDVLTNFSGGEGVIGIHGTNDPSVIGTDVSHGCIRLRNADITYLAQRLPLGTPVRILP